MRPFPTAGASMARAISIATARAADIFAALARELPPDAVWVTSNLVRTRQTAAAILAADDGRHGPVELIAVPDFAEQHLGEWQGLERKPFYAERKVGTHTLWFAPAHERAPGGESFVDLVERVRAADRASHRRASWPRHRRRYPWRHDPRRADAGARPRPAGGALLLGGELLAHPARLSEPWGGAGPVAGRRRQPSSLGPRRQARRHRRWPRIVRAQDARLWPRGPLRSVLPIDPPWQLHFLQ